MLGVKKEWIVEDGFKIKITDDGLVESELDTVEGTVKVWSIYNTGKMENYYDLWEKWTTWRRRI